MGWALCWPWFSSVKDSSITGGPFQIRDTSPLVPGQIPESAVPLSPPQVSDETKMGVPEPPLTLQPPARCGNHLELLAKEEPGAGGSEMEHLIPPPPAPAQT